MTFRLAHLSDPHLPVPLTLPAGLSLKQRLAFLSWLRKRRHVGAPHMQRALLDDIARMAPDHVAVTGDLTNLGLAAEQEAARDWLARIGPAEAVSVVPGNHDRTAPARGRDDLGCWAPWMADDRGGGGPDAFPFLRRRGPVALIGLSSALPTRIGSAAGELGAEQVARMTGLLRRAGREGAFRVVLIHHPPIVGPGGRRKGLRDRSALVRVLAAEGAELVLHGHHHVTCRRELPGPGGAAIPVLGVAAALAGSARHEPGGWQLHSIARAGAGWSVTTEARRWDPDTGRFGAWRSWGGQ